MRAHWQVYTHRVSPLMSAAASIKRFYKGLRKLSRRMQKARLLSSAIQLPAPKDSGEMGKRASKFTQRKDLTEAEKPNEEL